MSLRSWITKPTFSILILGIIIRLLMLYLPPQAYDMGTFNAWGSYVAQLGLAQTYQSYWSDYLPLPMLLFGLIHNLSSLTQLSFSLAFRLFWQIIESLLILFIVRHSHPSLNPQFKTSVLIFFWLFPPFLINTGWWGQIDSIPALLTVLSLIILPRHTWRAGLLYALAVALKPVMLIAGPVFAIIGWQRRVVIPLLITGLLTLTISGIPAITASWHNFNLQSLPRAFQFVLNQSLYQSSMYPGTTINGFNFWSITGQFWLSDQAVVLGINPQQLGYLLFGLSLIIILRNWRRYYSQLNPIFIAGQLLLSFYTFTTRMHERHLLFALPLLLLGAISRPLRWLVAVLAIIYSLNLYGALYWLDHNNIWPYSQPFLILCSLLVVFVTIIIVLFPTLSRHHFLRTRDFLVRHRWAVLLLILAFSLRIINLSHPQTMIFDEVYHSFTAQEYLANNIESWEWWTTPPSGFAYEWTHPPLAKYGMVIGMVLFGENSFGWRFGSVIMGVVSLAGLYGLALGLTRSVRVANLALFLGSFEGLHLVQSRIGMNDTYMLGFLVWSLYFVLKRQLKPSAILFGFALASKWSAIYGLIPLAIFYLTTTVSNPQFFSRLNNYFVTPLRLVLISIIIYFCSFAPFLVRGHSLDQLWELNRQMWFYHTGLVATHDYQSTPLTWIAVMRPVWYYVEYFDSARANIYAQGNPAILWFGLFAFLYLLLTEFKSRYRLLILPLIFTLPWVFSPRIMFFYHYLPTATLLSLPSALILSRIPRPSRIILLTIFITSFVILSPLYYGLPMPNQYWDTLYYLFPSWK